MLKNKEKLTDNDLIKLVKEEVSNDAFEELVNRHEKAFYKVAHKFSRKNPQLKLEELLEEIYIVFNNTIDKFKPEKCKFTTFLIHMSRWHFLNIYKNYDKTIPHENSEIEEINNSKNKYSSFKFNTNVEDVNTQVFKILNQLPDKRISKIYKERFIIGGEGNKVQSWREIAKKMSLSITMCLNLYKCGMKTLQKNIKKENY